MRAKYTNPASIASRVEAPVRASTLGLVRHLNHTRCCTEQVPRRRGRVLVYRGTRRQPHVARSEVSPSLRQYHRLVALPRSPPRRRARHAPPVDDDVCPDRVVFVVVHQQTSLSTRCRAAVCIPSCAVLCRSTARPRFPSTEPSPSRSPSTCPPRRPDPTARRSACPTPPRRTGSSH